MSYELYCECGALRSYVKEKVWMGSPIIADNHILLDGTSPEAGDCIKPCLKCGKIEYDFDPESPGIIGVALEGTKYRVICSSYNEG